jgi:hypothetical protein
MRALRKHRLNRSLEVHFLPYCVALSDGNGVDGNGRSNYFVCSHNFHRMSGTKSSIFFCLLARPHFQRWAVAVATTTANMAAVSSATIVEVAYLRRIANSRLPYSTLKYKGKISSSFLHYACLELKCMVVAWHWWLTPIILATWETEIKRIMV